MQERWSSVYVPNLTNLTLKILYTSSSNRYTKTNFIVWSIFIRRVRKIVKKKRPVTSSCLSVRPHAATPLPLDGLSWELILEYFHVILEYFSKICRENLSFITTSQEYRILNKNAYAYLSHLILLTMRNRSDKSCRGNQNTFYVPLLFSRRLTLYEITWKNIVKQGKPHVTIWRMRSAWWIPKATNTHSEYVILIAFPLQQWLRQRATVLRCTYIASSLLPPTHKYFQHL
jgi:hypothetical protein